MDIREDLFDDALDQCGEEEERGRGNQSLRGKLFGSGNSMLKDEPESYNPPDVQHKQSELCDWGQVLITTHA